MSTAEHCKSIELSARLATSPVTWPNVSNTDGAIMRRRYGVKLHTSTARFWAFNRDECGDAERDTDGRQSL